MMYGFMIDFMRWNRRPSISNFNFVFGNKKMNLLKVVANKRISYSVQKGLVDCGIIPA